MIWVLLQSESLWQRNDAITFFIYRCVSLYQEFFEEIWGKNWLYLRPYLKAFPVFNVPKTCRKYFLTIDFGIVEIIKKFIERFLEKCEILRHRPNYLQKLYQKHLNAS